jgi:quercetin dioxygenase-like cupin family protein
MKTITGLIVSLVIAGSTLAAAQDNIAVTPLVSKDLAGVPGRELVMIAVEYAPGATEPIHTHQAQAFVYVLEGSIVMQVKGGPPTTLTAGQTFYEGPDDVHIVGRNVSQTARAKFVVFLAKGKGAPIATPAAPPSSR